MRNRKSANSRYHKKQFTRTASGTHAKNLRATPMRGGFRL